MASASPGEIQFGDIIREEIDAINQRRDLLRRAPLSAENASGPDGQVLDVVGLALSGGGIRSAAFSLGVLQAINHNDALRNIDYLSTVSGGGYIGCALTATMTRTDGQFVFGNPAAENGKQTASEIADTPAVGHLRNYSNYLIPAGARDALTGAAIVLRGLVANVASVLAIVLLFAAATVATNPKRSLLGCPDILGFDLCGFFWVDFFAFSLIAGLAGLALYFLWALYRSVFLRQGSLAEFRTHLPALAAGYLVAGLVIFVFDLQSFFLRGMFDLADANTSPDEATFDWLATSVQTLAAVFAPIAAVVTIFRQQMGDILKAASADANLTTRIIAALSKVAFWLAAAALPFAIWVVYLYLSYWGIINDARQWYEDKPQPAVSETRCGRVPPAPDAQSTTVGQHTPHWMVTAASNLTYSGFCPLFRRPALWAAEHTGFKWFAWYYVRALERPMVLLYTGSGLMLILLVLLLKPNANSLHRLYRDRLSKAFLFDPHPPDAPAAKRNEASIDQGRDFAQLDDMAVSSISVRHAPYHLINAALNIQGSDFANRRGRNADFFMFSPHHVGSAATGYAATAAFEQKAKGLDVATAMAISGAAASSNMGSQSIRPLRPTLALLNIRLGYWLKNPRYVSEREPRWSRLSDRFSFFLLSEILGRLYENSNNVYLTDGGHIENLGVYELLKRRCKLIVVSDAEADISMRFPSFITLQRYARIDLGVRIEMPWDDIRKTTSAWMGLHTKDTGAAIPSAGPHAAIGYIDYGEGRSGTILYLKASLSGDENDYIRDYARRFPMFPHETTGDQFFSEEQFEVYRALGFHVAHGVLSGRDNVSAPSQAGPEQRKFDSTGNQAVEDAHAALIG
ncbi:MAG: cell division protein [Alphaproteobacteria bacterium]|nr:MAG: cell division protein [Alphaproteobacteria bacterium]